MIRPKSHIGAIILVGDRYFARIAKKRIITAWHIAGAKIFQTEDDPDLLSTMDALSAAGKRPEVGFVTATIGTASNAQKRQKERNAGVTCNRTPVDGHVPRMGHFAGATIDARDRSKIEPPRESARVWLSAIEPNERTKLFPDWLKHADWPEFEQNLFKAITRNDDTALHYVCEHMPNTAGGLPMTQAIDALRTLWRAQMKEADTEYEHSADTGKAWRTLHDAGINSVICMDEMDRERKLPPGGIVRFDIDFDAAKNLRSVPFYEPDPHIGGLPEYDPDPTSGS